MYDLLFYPFHRSFHASQAPLAWRQQHNRHHRWGHEQPHAHNACETVQNSYLDAGIQVMINIFVQNISPWGFGAKHPLSRVAHNLMVTYLLSEAHSGYDLPFQSHRLFPAVFGGSVRHEEHHQRGSVCYHQFFKYIDDTTGAGPRFGAADTLLPCARAGTGWLALEAAAAEEVSRGTSRGTAAAAAAAGVDEAARPVDTLVADGGATAGMASVRAGASAPSLQKLIVRKKGAN